MVAFGAADSVELFFFATQLSIGRITNGIDIDKNVSIPILNGNTP